MKSRDAELKANWGTICTLVPMTSEDGKRHKEMAASTEGVFRIIQSIPSPKAEPFKQWMAQVAAERLNQLQDPELSIHQAMEDYKRLGYSDNRCDSKVTGETPSCHHKSLSINECCRSDSIFEAN